MKKVLYLGTDPSCFVSAKPVIHFPVIKLIPKDWKVDGDYSYYIFTSKNAVTFFCAKALVEGEALSIGPSTTTALQTWGITPLVEAEPSTQEGLRDAIFAKITMPSRFLYPRSCVARPLLVRSLQERGHAVCLIDLYDTVAYAPGPLPSWDEIGEVFFTSPSTVRSFGKLFGSIPSGIQITCQGPITLQAWQAMSAGSR